MKNFKVFVDNKGKEIIEHLKNIGYNKDTGQGDEEYSFVFAKDGDFTLGNINRHFQISDLPRLTAKEVLALRKEPEFKPFDKVLIRDRDDSTWEAAMFGRVRDGYFRCIDLYNWNQCIPYKGNENLHGTNKNPE